MFSLFALRSSLFCAICAICGPAVASPPAIGANIDLAGGLTVRVVPGQAVDDARIDAQLADCGGGEYELRVTARTAIERLWFPFHGERWTAGSSADDDLVYATQLAGTVQPMRALGDWAWQVAPYPGSITPWAAIADDSTALSVASRTWPPQRCRVLWCRGRLAIEWGALGVGESRTLRIAVRTFTAAPGVAPWQASAEDHAAWIRSIEPRLPAITWSSAARLTDGWLARSMADYAGDSIDLAAFERDVDLAASLNLNWLQVWGQMSAHGGACCAPDRALHPRSAALLHAVGDRVIGGGGLFGLYTRPRTETVDLARDCGEYVWMRDWMRDGTRNAVYLDTIGGYDFGPPLLVAQRVAAAAAGRNLVGEGACDVYPWPSLMSGAICQPADGRHPWPGGRGRVPLRDGASACWQLGRLLLPAREWFLGQSNDFRGWWQQDDHYVEDVVFLSGSLFDAWNLTDAAGAVNPAIPAIVGARAKVRWHLREPRFRDTIGITRISGAIEVARFTDKNNRNLFCVVNRSGQPAQFVALGKLHQVTPDRWQIVE